MQKIDVLICVLPDDFDARSGDELTLRRSERVELIELDDGFHDGWYLGKHLARGGTGLFPGVYTTKAPTATRVTPSHSPTHSQSATHHATTVGPQVPRLSINSAATSSSPVNLPDPSSENARASLPASHHTTYVQRTIGEALGEHDKGSDSPVMNETLNVIDEHITDLSTPRQTVNYPKARDDSDSEYSSHLDRQSYLAGPETDDEENGGLDEATVRSWDHVQTAQHLRDIGVDPKHCDIFAEQEISGDVLLDMDQNFIYMKEFDFGVMGRRLKTWHKVRDFQREVLSRPSGSRKTSTGGRNSSIEDIGRMTGHTMSTPSLSRLRQAQDTPPIEEESSDVPHPLQPSQYSKRTSWAGEMPGNTWKSAALPDSPARTNASANRHSRRHSSIDFGGQPDLDLSSLSTTSPKNKSSTDRTWSVAGTGSTQATTPASSIRPSTKVDDVVAIPSPAPQEHSPLDFDRGYFSGNDIDNRKTRNRLSKGPRNGHSRQASASEQQSKRTSMIKRHARISSAGSIREDSALAPSHAPGAYRSQTKTGRFRSASARATSAQSSPVAPAVTNLENDTTSKIGSPAVEKMKMQDRARKLMGFRATSEAVTPEEKSNAIKMVPSTDTAKSSELVASPTTGDTTPSATPSLEMEASEGVDMSSVLSKYNTRPRPKNKQRTSAYTHGLLKIPPSEARKTCDHSGWMKKKASGLMTTWKPRLFILRGRRLSYYYSENDTEERGIIDISAHKVLVANNDPMVTIHASVTGASKASSTPRLDALPASPVKAGVPSDVFYFKLLPPKSGMSRAVQFTKPAIHYFQVDSIAEGRKWMGEIMKATIEHDLASFETTNKQKTISLAKARAKRERPPALEDTKPADVAEEQPDQESETMKSGLGIDFEDAPVLGSDAQMRGSMSSKVMSTLGLAPKASFRKSNEDEDHRFLPKIAPGEDKENVLEPSEASDRSSKA